MKSTSRPPFPYAVLPLLLSALFVAAFVALPPLVLPVARGGDLPSRAQGLVTAWVVGGGERPAPFGEFVDGWRDYHVLKAALAAAAGVALWRVARDASRRWVVGARAYGQVVILVAAGGLGLLAALVVIANLQGALAPLASAVSLLPRSNGDASYAAMLARLSAAVSGGGEARATRVAGAVLTDFAFFHLVLAILAALLAAALLVAARQLWRRRRGPAEAGQAGRREYRLLTMLSAVAVGAALLTLVVAAANLSTAGDPVPGLTAYLDGLRH